jgi:hypothetical protein
VWRSAKLSSSGLSARPFCDREPYVLLPRGAKYDQGKRLYAGWGDFPEIAGKRLEWRYHGSKLVALIVRNEWTEQSDGDSKNVSGLVIWRVDTSKLDKACAVGRTTSS